MKNKNTGIKIICFASLGVSVLFLTASLLVNFVPSITVNLFFPKGASYEAAVDRFFLIGAAITTAVLLLYGTMVLRKTFTGSVYKWYHVALTVFVALFAVVFPLFMNMLGFVEVTYNYTNRVISHNCYVYMTSLYRVETLIRFISVIADALAVGAFCGSYYNNKKNTQEK